MKKLKQAIPLFISMMLPYVFFAQTTNVTNLSPNEHVAESKKFLNESTHNDFYLITSSAFGLKKKQAYYKNSLLLYNGFEFGVTDNFSLGVSSFIPFFYNLSTKVNKSLSKKVHIAGGLNFIYAVEPLEETNTIARIIQPYIVTTFGNKDKNFTIGGRNFFGKFALTVGGQLRLSEHFSLITDNLLTFSTYAGKTHVNATLSGGVRYMKKRFTFDAGFLPGVWFENAGIPILSATFFF